MLINDVRRNNPRPHFESFAAKVLVIVSSRIPLKFNVSVRRIPSARAEIEARYPFRASQRAQLRRIHILLRMRIWHILR